ncbi:MAG TPA: DUF5348 domain-containing protein [Ktedonobacteraceae bacterium]|nr:DUF5348 domain-containing protein [Ktedonobacteraceae bacterium]
MNEKEGSLELARFLLQSGDQVEIRVLGSWLCGTIRHDTGGWYFLTQKSVGIRLHTGLAARLLFLSSVAS